MDNIHIFDNIKDRELKQMMLCFKSQIKNFSIHEQLLHSSAKANQIGVILSGEADLIKYDYRASGRTGYFRSPFTAAL